MVKRLAILDHRQARPLAIHDLQPRKCTLATLGDFPNVLKANDAAIKRIKLLTHFISIAGLEFDI